MTKKFVLILLDGLGDRSHAELGGKTPLQAADTPYLDSLAARGCCGLYHASGPGQALPSENAHFVMFGYDHTEFPGRGALEALGAGISLDRKQVAVLTHFVSVREEQGKLRLMRDKVEADKEEAEQALARVAEFTSGNVHIRLVPTKGLFGVLVLTGKVSPLITDSNPILDGNFLSAIKPLQKAAGNENSLETAEALTEYLSWSYNNLKKAPFNLVREKSGKFLLNALVTQRAGQLKDRLPFELKNGIKGLSISSGVVYQGLGAYLGMDIIRGSELNDPGREIEERVETARQNLQQYDFIHIHSKAPDEAAHRKDPLLKKQVIESLDEGLRASLPRLLENKDVIVAVTADHSTPSSGPLVHSGEPVPLLITGPGIRVDEVDKFDEISTACGGLGFVRGSEFMYLVLNYLDRSKLIGLMDIPEDRPYWPGGGEPFILN